MQKKIVWFDLDDTMCDFKGSARARILKQPKTEFPQSEYGFYADLPPIKGAIEAYRKIEMHYDVGILTRPSIRNISCYSEKAYWVQKHLGFEALNNLVFSCDKSRIKGDFLVDDATNARQKDFEGYFIHLWSETFPDMSYVVDFLVNSVKLRYKQEPERKPDTIINKQIVADNVNRIHELEEELWGKVNKRKKLIAKGLGDGEEVIELTKSIDLLSIAYIQAKAV
jgi:hypothetical protein